ncbi:hypothetical protein [Massilistercora timonensis]|uniref:hypothetical protein n=1 Tax=Massilistercora timonensis TaxID=2086584 RepID=UPI003AB48E1C
MNTEILMQYFTYALIAIGVLAFLVSIITQVIKEMPGLKNIQTNAVALAVSVILCPVSVIIACQYFNIVITWYYVFASFIAAFIVYLVSTGGWEKVAEMWERTKYNRTK